MAGLPIITGEFRLGGDPELRFTPSGKAVANFSAVTNKRIKNGDQWEDGDPLWLRFTAWGAMAENVAESLVQGTLVLITGELESRKYQTREGEDRLSWEVNIHSIGPSLKWDAAKVQKVERQGGSRGGAQEPARQAAAGQENQGPWANNSVTPEEPPF